MTIFVLTFARFWGDSEVFEKQTDNFAAPSLKFKLIFKFCYLLDIHYLFV